MIRTIAYVDGYNLYNGLMDERYVINGNSTPKPLRKYLWLNLHSFILSYLPKDTELTKIHYFTAPIRRKPDSKKRQQMYWKALQTLPNIEFHYGRFKDDEERWAEKQTDVRIALQMYSDAIATDVKRMVLISGDSDQVPTIEYINALKQGIELCAIFPPFRHPDELKDLIPNHHHIKYKRLRDHQFPDVIKRGNAPDIIKPPEWC
jgi:uncharacterized LabA/DUF88 family protein